MKCNIFHNIPREKGNREGQGCSQQALLSVRCVSDLTPAQAVTELGLAGLPREPLQQEHSPEDPCLFPFISAIFN